ncbi:MAG: lipoate--protein ligase family protein [Euryarchaeota archaeon]|nr:lipoate--protein ligase family protein [Euryarchaeota archaeon]
MGIQIVRRMSGGSAIYTDPDQIIYSLVLEKEMVPESPIETFEIICAGIVRALDILGLEAEFKPVNDVLIRDRKVSGSAQTRKGNVVIQHGTVIVDADFDLMFKVLKTRKKKIRSPEGMTSLTAELGRKPTMEEVKAAIIQGFSEEFGVEIVRGVLTHFEERTIRQLVEEKYGKEEYALLR